MSTRTEQLAMDAADVDRALGGRLLGLAQRQPGAIDLLVAAACLAVQTLVLVIAPQRPLWPLLACTGVSSALLLWRRRFPVGVLVIIAVISTVDAMLPVSSPTVVTIPAAVMVYTVAASRTIGWALTGYAVAVILPTLGTFVAALVRDGPAHSATLLEPLALVALALGIAVRSAAQRREALAELMNERLATARVVERQRITAEMHDVVAHSLSTMVALADGASSGWEKHPERSTQALVKLGDVGRTALTEMQRILQVLREDDPVLDDELHRSGHNVPDLEELVDVYRIAGLPVRLSRKGQSVSDDPILATTVYRIVTEALTNALRYAKGATQVDVDFEVAGDELTIRVNDNGRAAPDVPSQGAHRGLVGITERAAAHGGTSTAGPRPEGGWATTATLKIGDITEENSRR
ncbi:MAG: sensor histidine kinase [Brevibacterium linens]